MSALRFALLAAVTGVLTAGSVAAPLRIIRTTPVGDAGPLPAITVTFDRPVAGSLDRTVDPATVLHVEPAIPGRLEWRDPVTIRLVPSAPLPADTRYTVTISNAFTAMDGQAHIGQRFERAEGFVHASKFNGRLAHGPFL